MEEMKPQSNDTCCIDVACKPAGGEQSGYVGKSTTAYIRDSLQQPQLVLCQQVQEHLSILSALLHP